MTTLTARAELAEGLLRFARDLVSDNEPTEVELRRAVSSAYYGMFHLLCWYGASVFLGEPGYGTDTWEHIYRSLGHREAKRGCNKASGMVSLPKEVREFAVTFVKLQVARESADYAPSFRPSHADAISYVGAATVAVYNMITIDGPMICELCAYCFFKGRPE